MHSTTAKLLLLSIPLLVASCRGNVKDDVPPPAPTIITQTVYVVCDSPPKRESIELRPIVWRVIDDRFTLAPEGYEDLSYNMIEIWKGVEQLLAEIEYYASCAEEMEGSDTDVD